MNIEKDATAVFHRLNRVSTALMKIQTKTNNPQFRLVGKRQEQLEKTRKRVLGMQYTIEGLYKELYKIEPVVKNLESATASLLKAYKDKVTM